jgi:hypothetical protein
LAAAEMVVEVENRVVGVICHISTFRLRKQQKAVLG